MLGGGALDVPLEDHAHHGLDLLANYVGRNAHDPIAAGAHDRECLIVVTGPDPEAVRRAVDNPGYLHRIAGRLFHADDVVYLRESESCGVVHVKRSSRGHIVENAGQGSGGRNRLEMLVQPFLGRLVVRRDSQQKSVRADLLCLYRQLHRLAVVVVSRARDYRGLFSDLFLDLGEQADLLVVAHGRRLARRSADHQPVGA